jgi:hypothetical protein
MRDVKLSAPTREKGGREGGGGENGRENEREGDREGRRSMGEARVEGNRFGSASSDGSAS